MGTIHLTGQLVCANEGEAEAVVLHLPQHIELTRAEHGCLFFDVTATADRFVWNVEERFGDQDAFNAHQQRVADSEWGRETAGIERRYSIDGLTR